MDITLILLLTSSLLIPFIAKYFLNNTINYQELGLHCLIVIIVVSSIWTLGKWSLTDDTEIWNGQILSKHRDHGTYEEAYDCMCSTDSNGNESCSTCYTTHYTVDWYAKTTLGNIQFDNEDSTWISIYNTTDPVVFTNCKVGQPASLPRKYTNYIQAVPQSLFHETGDPNNFIGKIPNYPKVHSFYQFDRVINIDSTLNPIQIGILDSSLDHSLKIMGAEKQVNIILILTEIDDPTYRYAVEQSWLGGKKNDVVIFIGLDKENITWVDIMTWALNTGNELFHVTLRDNIRKQNHIDYQKLVPLITETVYELYNRPVMTDYEHLKEEIVPPTWIIVLAMIFAYLGGLGLVYLFHTHDVDFR